MLKVYGCLVLVCVAVVYGEDSGAQLDKAFAVKDKETMQMYESVDQQLSAAQEVTGLFVLEDAQLEMFALETRANLVAIKDEVRQEIEESMKEVESLQQRAVENVATWRKTLQRIKDVTQKNKQTLQRINKEKEDKKQLELELEKQRELEKELELHTEELRQLQELERLQELEKKKLLERKQNMKKQKMENQYEQSEEPEASTSDLNGEFIVIEKDAMSFESAEHESGVKRLLAWYVFAEHTLLETVASIYRQFVLPVVAIIAFFLMLTVAIGRYNAMKQARRNRRVLYSGYPKSYRPKPHPETKQILTDVRPRVRNPVPRHDSNTILVSLQKLTTKEGCHLNGNKAPHNAIKPFIDEDHPIQQIFLPYHYAISIPAVILVLLFSSAATFIGLVMIKSQKKKSD
ncbi:hypothetical protein DD237_006100 [Peronospora effusa]|uniref:Uncharacterized protein n=1 Tax=Peronospora effusa TaxID=542832 RepID=A0A3R7WN77_9STRA|nr:hypothetical protein DD237_006100 [Peronospora effusa]